MAARKSSSIIPLVAVVFSLVLVAAFVVIAYLPKSQPSTPETTPAVAETIPALPPPDGEQGEEIASALPAPTPTPAPTATPSPTPSPTPTPAAVVATAPPQEIERPTVPEGRVLFRGRLVDHLGQPVENGALYVVTRGSGAPAEVVRAAFENERTHTIIRTNRDGFAELAVEPQKAYIVGYMVADEPQSLMQEISPEREGAFVEAEIRKPRPLEIRGNVSSDRLRVIPGVTLKATWTPQTLRARPVSSVEVSIQTDREGRYSLLMDSPLRVSFDIAKDELATELFHTAPPLQLRLEDFGDLGIRVQDYVLQTGIAVTGRVALPSEADTGAPAVGAVVTLNPIGDFRETLRVETDRNGRFFLPKVYPQRYAVDVTIEDLSVHKIDSWVPQDGQSLEIALRQQTPLEGKIVASGGYEGPVSIRLLDRYRALTAQAVTGEDGNGSFTLIGARPGQYLLTAKTDDGRLYGERFLELGESDRWNIPTLALEALTEANGSILAPRDSTSLRVMEVDSDEARFPMESRVNDQRVLPSVSFLSEADVRVSNLKEDRRYVVSLIDDQSEEVLGTAWIVGGSTERFAVGSDGVGSIAGRLRNTNNEACRNVRVVVTTGLASLEGRPVPMQTRTVTSSFDGSFRFDAVPVGAARIQIEGDPTTSRLITIQKGRTLDVAMECRSFVAVTFSVRDALERPFRDDEQFLVLPKPGTRVLQTVKEMTYDSLHAELEPGSYTITRTTTMQSRSFDVLPRLDGIIEIDFR